jgi:UDP-N-acetylmuramoyl-tripeptide--D-alanyl-D-alanine ligase
MKLNPLIFSLAKRIIRRRKPTIVGVTGSVGGATTVAAIAAVLTHGGHHVRLAPRSQSDVFNLAAAIIGGYGSAASIPTTRQLLWRGLRGGAPRQGRYPDVLIVEYAADVPGEMEATLALAVPNISVVTSRAPVHVRNFGTMEKAFAERASIVKAMTKEGTVILLGDDAHIKDLAKKTKATVMTYGLTDEQDVRAIELKVNQQINDAQPMVDGTAFKLVTNGNTVPTLLSEVIGGGHVHAALAATSVGLALGMNLVAISDGLKTYKALPGRTHVLPGIKRTLLLDDSYNASSVSCIAGLAAMEGIVLQEGCEKFAVIGEMMYLGDYTQEQYAAVGDAVVEYKADYLLTVGHAAQDIGTHARKKGMDESRIYHFTKAEEAGKFLQDRLEKGDMAFITGNKEARMERIVREVMADPAHAKTLLVRQ